METTPRIQTAFRLKPDLITRLKREAKLKGISLNALVENTLEREHRVEWPCLPKDFTASEEIRSLSFGELPEPTEEELEQDPKLAYLWNKHVKPYAKKD